MVNLFKLHATKQTLLRWCGWFFTANSLLFWLLGLKYIHSISWLGSGYLTKKNEIVISVFLLLSYFSQLTLVAFLPFFLIALMILIYPRRHVIFVMASLIAAAAVVLLISDTIIYNLFHFHLNGIVLGLVLHSTNEQFFDFSIYEEIAVVCIICSAILVEFGIAYGLWHGLQRPTFLRGAGKWVAAVLGLTIYTSYSMLLLSANRGSARFYLEAARVFPLYIETLGAMLPIRDGTVALERIFERYMVQPAQVNQVLDYPKQPLHFAKTNKQPFNILMIGIDTWRFDMLNATVTPNVYQFAQTAQQFTQHFSGGNATGPGVFSLFYGLPESYWTSMANQHREPVLLEELQKRHYQIKILASAGLTLPPFHKTIFQQIKNLKLKMAGNDPHDRDLVVTNDFMQFLAERDTSKPFFSFLFYDASHSYCSTKHALSPFHPVIKQCERLGLNNNTNVTLYLNRYKNALYSVDNEVGKVLAELKKRGLLENTVVIITGDHGEEFNDNKLGYWGHTSNFTHYQIQTPLVVYWPGMPAATQSYLTTHYDIAPTLMEKIMGCKTPADQYSLGHSLWKNQPSEYLLEGSYIGYGVVEKSRITNIFPMGNYQVTQLNGQVLPNAKLNPETMHAVYLEMQRFYKS